MQNQQAAVSVRGHELQTSTSWFHICFPGIIAGNGRMQDRRFNVLINGFYRCREVDICKKSQTVSCLYAKLTGSWIELQIY